MALEDRFSSVSEAMEYFMPARILGSHKVDEGDLYAKWVFWSSNPDENYVAHRSIEEKIRLVLIVIPRIYNSYSIVQFWAVERNAGSKCILTTTHQPFHMIGLDKCYYSYRKECMRRTISVGPEANEAQLGPPGRAFRNRSVEFSPNIRLYTIQEFALRDHAILCDLKGLVSFPVFELDSNNIVGVLEFLCSYGIQLSGVFADLNINLKEVGLSINFNGLSESVDREKYSDDIPEVHKMFKEVAKTLPLAAGLAFAPCGKEHCLICSGKGCLDKPIAVYKDPHMHSLRRFHTQINGISGRAYVSGKSCFCRNIRNLSILEYPLAHHAREAGLTFSFATCVKSIQDENNNVLVLEFLLLPGSYEINTIRLVTGSLLRKIKELLPSYNVAEADFPGEELFPDNYEYDEIEYVNVVDNPISLPVTLSCSSGVLCQKCCLYELKEVVDFFLPIKLSYEASTKNSLLEGSLDDDDQENLHDAISSDDDEGHFGYVFWRNDKECDEVDERIKHAFKRVGTYDMGVELVQFWAPKRVAGRYFLTTSDQPFAINKLCDKVTCLYRKECMRRIIYIDGEGNNKEQLGPVGRAFINGVVEFSPDVKLYTVKEFPLRDHAVLWNIQKAMFLPVFELDGKGTVGVIEIIFDYVGQLGRYLNHLTRELKEMGLRIDDVDPQPELHTEIEEILNAVSVRCPLQLTRPLTPSLRDCSHKDSSLRYISNIWSRTIDDTTDISLMECSFHHFIDENGVAGKALASRRSCFCMNIGDWGIKEYPLSHYAELSGCNFSVAICVENTQLVETPCVLEFFLLPGDYSNGNIVSLLHSLLETVKELLPPNFKILKEHVPGEPFFLEIGKHLENGESYHLLPQANISGTHIEDYQENISSIHIVDGTEATTLDIPGENTYEMHVVAGTEATTLQIQDENIYDMPVADGIEATSVPQRENIWGMHVAVGTRPIAEGENDCSTKPSSSQMKRKKGNKGEKLRISWEEITLYFGKTLEETANHFGVHKSTIKRRCRENGVRVWPSHEKNVANSSLFMNQTPNDAPHIVEDMTLGSSEADSAVPVLPMQPCVHSTPDLIQTVQHQGVSYRDSEVAKIVNIKASYGQGAFIKFKLNERSTLQDLQEQVSKRLKWDANMFEIKYQDEAKDWITIIIDEDLKDFLQASIDRCESTVFMSINLVKHVTALQNAGVFNSKESELQPHKGWSQNYIKRFPSSFEYTREKGYDSAANIKFDPASTTDVHGYGGHGCGPELVSIKNTFTPFCVGHHLSCLTRFPSFLAPYIVGCLDVEEDGHCGFRAVARHVHGDQEYWMRVRQELVLELDERATLYDKTLVFNNMFSVRNALLWWSPIGCGNKNWMNSDMGFMIATRYNKVFVLLSETSSQTYLPLTQDDSMPIDGEIVVFHSNNHFIALKMSMNFPLPPIPVTWPNACTNSVSDLTKFYQSRLTKYLEIRGPPPLPRTPIMID